MYAYKVRLLLDRWSNFGFVFFPITCGPHLVSEPCFLDVFLNHGAKAVAVLPDTDIMSWIWYL